MTCCPTTEKKIPGPAAKRGPDGDLDMLTPEETTALPSIKVSVSVGLRLTTGLNKKSQSITLQRQTHSAKPHPTHAAGLHYNTINTAPLGPISFSDWVLIYNRGMPP